MTTRIQGTVRNARQTFRQETDVAGVVIEGARRVLDFIPLFERRSTRHVPPKQITVWSFLVELTTRSSLPHPVVSAEISGQRIKGIVRDGDEVVVTGKLDRTRNVFIATEIRSLRTREIIRPG
jgi:hypothetical protein